MLVYRHGRIETYPNFVGRAVISGLDLGEYIRETAAAAERRFGSRRVSLRVRGSPPGIGAVYEMVAHNFYRSGDKRTAAVSGIVDLAWLTKKRD